MQEKKEARLPEWVEQGAPFLEAFFLFFGVGLLGGRRVRHQPGEKFAAGIWVIMAATVGLRVFVMVKVSEYNRNNRPYPFPVTSAGSRSWMSMWELIQDKRQRLGIGSW